jgi:dynactin 1
MRITIEDIETLQELNDEIDEDHVGTEKALQKALGEIRSMSCR